jgi:hypothetical protein
MVEPSPDANLLRGRGRRLLGVMLVVRLVVCRTRLVIRISSGGERQRRYGESGQHQQHDGFLESRFHLELAIEDDCVEQASGAWPGAFAPTAM